MAFGLHVRPSINGKKVVVPFVLLAIGWLTLAPVATLIYRTFWPDGAFALDGFVRAFTAPGIGGMLWHTILFAVGATVVSIVLGTFFAYITVRTNTPGASVIWSAMLVLLIVPNILYTFAWVYVGSPRTGIINVWVMKPLGLPAFDIFSMTGMILVEGLGLAPIAFLLLYASFRGMDASLEEAALMAGARRRTVLWRISRPLATPALVAALLIMVIRGLEAFEVPALIGMPDGIFVFTSRIWRELSIYPPDLPMAGSYSIVLIALTAVGIYVMTKMGGQAGRSFQTITGKGFRPRKIDVGRWRWIFFALNLAFFLFAAILPCFILLYASTQRYYTVPSLHSIGSITLDNYRVVLSNPGTRTALWNSVRLSIGAATVVMLVAGIAAWLVVRSQSRARWLIDFLAFIPLLIPGIVLGAALLSVYLRLPMPIYGTLWILLIAYVTRFLPYGMRYAISSLHQLASELEESAVVAGASWTRVLRRIVFPLILPGLTAGWLYVCTVSIRELSSSLLLYSPGNEVVSIAMWNEWQNGLFTRLSALGVLIVLVLAVLVVGARSLSAKFGVADSN